MLGGGGWGVQEDEQRAKGRRKGRMELTQDVGNRHHRGWGPDRAALSEGAFINNARGGPGGADWERGGLLNWPCVFSV